MNLNERLYRERLFKTVKHLFPPGLHVLDAGCGPGAMAQLLTEHDCDVTAIDGEDYTDDWQQNKNRRIKFFQQNLEDIEFDDGSFDAVWIQDTLHHMAYPERALAECLRVAKAGAPVVVVESNRHNPLGYVRMTLLANHQAFTRRQFRNKLDLYQQAYEYYMVETRALPINQPIILKLFNQFCNVVEKMKVTAPWINYQIGVLRGQGHRVEVNVETGEPMRRREARISGEVIRR